MSHSLSVVVPTPAHSSLGGPLSYRSEFPLAPGTLVRVPLGKREVLAVSRLESGGAVRRAESEIDPVLVADAHARYAAERDADLPADHIGPRPHGGVGGTRTGIKCLHAHYAWFLAGGNDPVGAWVAQRLAEQVDSHS